MTRAVWGSVVVRRAQAAGLLVVLLGVPVLVGATPPAERPAPIPAALLDEDRHVRTVYEEPKVHERLPAFVDRAALRSALPPEVRDAFDEVDRDHAAGVPIEGVRGALLDVAGSRYLLLIQLDTPPRMLVVISAETGAVLDAWRLPDRGRVRLLDAWGDERREVFLETVHGDFLSILPMTWTLLMLDGDDRLVPLVTFPRTYRAGPKEPRCCFLNHVEFPDRRTLRLRTTHFEAGCLTWSHDAGGAPVVERAEGYLPGAPTREGETLEFRLDPGGDRVVATSRAGADLLAIGELLREQVGTRLPPQGPDGQ